MTSLMTFGAFSITHQQRDRFVNGKLSQDWYDKYPAIFDEDDLRLAKSQPRNHFYEWLAAILIYHSTGCYSLVEKYQYTKDRHKRKPEIIERINSAALNAALAHHGNYGDVQCPDLLVYAPDLTDWFFCEVKGGNDKLGLKQDMHFQALQELTGKPIQFIQFNYVSKNTSERNASKI
jgi:hypothetical protein